MITVSDEWRRYFYEYRSHLLTRGILTTTSGHVYYLDYEDGDDDFIEMSLADATSSENSFDVGNFVLNTCTFKLNNSDRKWKNIVLENAKLEPYVGFQHPRLNYALASGNYNTDSNTGAWTASATSFSSYYTITAYDGYMRLYCKTATSTAYYTYLTLTDDFDSSAEYYTVTFKVRASTSKAINVYAKRENKSGTSSYTKIGTIPASDVTANTWAEHSITFSPNEDYTYTGIGFSMGTFNASGNYLDVEYLIVEQGEEFTEYNRAREDFTENGVEWVKKGTFYISDTGKRGSRISLTAYDNTNAFETSFSGVSITYPITIANFVKKICDYVGVTLATTTFTNSTYSISTAPNTSSTDYTCRQMISYAAMLAGCYARCNVDGELELKWYDSTTDIHTVPAYSSFDNSESDTEITGVKVIAMASENVDSSTDDDSSESKSDEYTYGSSGGYLITIQDNPLIPYGNATEVAKLIGTQVIGTTFRSSELEALYDPSMEAGDTVKTENEDGDTVTFYAANISVKIGSYVTVKCSSDESNSSSGSTSVLSYIMGQTADLVNAKFENFITKNLSAEVANIGYLTADSATIIDLTASAANITAILSGSIGTGTLQSIHITSDNAVFDEAVINDAAIASLTANKITSGTIYTSLVTIQTSEDSKALYIADDLIAMYDTNSVLRLQAGSTDSLTGEENGYNFVIWDADGTQLFNATGITASGIPRETIVNAHVSENAAISGSKLDITSVISSIEEDGSLKVDYANVTIDNTTLDYTLTTITNNVDAAQKAAQEAADAATNAQNYAEGVQRDAAEELSKYAQSVSETLEGLQAQVDGQIETWYYDYAPTLANLPASDWTTDDEKEAHIGDLFFDKSTGYSYRFFNNDGTYEWVLIQDTDITTALATASTAQDTADSKKRVFTSTPTPPYDVGDLWTDGTDIKTCMKARASGATYVSSDWVVLNEYANQEAVDAAQQAADDAKAAADAVEKRTTTLETNLTVVQGQIEAKIWQTDIDTAVGDLEGDIKTITDQYSDITTKIGSITSEVGDLKTTVSNNYTELSDNISKVTQTAEGITSTVESIQTWIDNTDVGGTNLLAGTKDFSGSGGTHTDTGDTYQGCTVISYTKSSSSTYVDVVSWGAIDVIPEQYYTLSFWAKADDEATIRSYFYPDCCETAESSTGGTGTAADGAVETTIGTSWARYWVTWKTLSTADGAKNVLPVRLYTATTIYIAGVKLEYGNVATAWSPAPEDTEASISSVKSQISQLANEITLSVDGGLGSKASISITYGDNTSSGSIDLSDIRSAFAKDDTNITIAAGTITFASNTLIVGSDDFTLDANGNADFSGTLSTPTGIIGGWTLDSTAIYKRSPVVTSTDSTQYEVALSAPDSPTTSTYALYVAHRAWTSNTYGSRSYDFYLTYGGYMYAAGGGKIGAWTLGSGTSGALYSGSCSSLTSTSAGTYIGADGFWQYGSSSAHVKIANGVIEAKGGTFYGEVTATSGTFTGTIKAGAGSTLGGWTLNEDSISSDKITITADSFNFSDGSSATFGSGDSTTTIDGETGDITTTTGTFATGGTITTKLSDDDETYVNIIGDSIYFTDMGVGSQTGVIKAVTMADFSATGDSTSHGLYVGAGADADFVSIGRSNGDYLRGDIEVYRDTQTFDFNNDNSTFMYQIGIYGDTIISGNLAFTGSLCAPNGLSVVGYNDTITIFYLDGDDNLIVGDKNYITAIYGSSILMNGDTYKSSDARLKTDFTTLTNYSGVFDQLLPVSYRFKDNPDKIHFGFTTQDTQAALEAYGYDADDYALLGHADRDGEEYGTLAYTEVIALLVHEVQELKSQVRSLQANA